MSLSSIVNVIISRQTTAVTQKGFGTALVVGSTGKLTQKVQPFPDITSVEAVFTNGDPELEAARRLFGQELVPEQIKIAQRDADQAQVNNVLVASVLDNTLYRVTINGTNFDFTSDGTATANEISAGLAAAINGGSEPVSASDNLGDLDITADVAGDPFTISVNDTNLLTLTETTANRNISTELAAIEAFDADWFALISVSRLPIDIERAADFIETREKIYITASRQPEIFTTSVSDIATTLKNKALDQTALLSVKGKAQVENVLVASVEDNTLYQITINGTDFDFTSDGTATAAEISAGLQAAIAGGSEPVTALDKVGSLDITADVAGDSFTITVNEITLLTLTSIVPNVNIVDQFPDAAWAGLQLPRDPGSSTWAFKTLSGITVDELNPTEQANASGKNANLYLNIGGVNITTGGDPKNGGIMASGEFIDVIRGVFLLTARIRERVFSRLVNLPKIPFTNAGISIIVSQVESVMALGIGTGILSADPAPVVTAPDAADVDFNDKANRILPDVTFDATLAGAIHKITIRGVVTV